MAPFHKRRITTRAARLVSCLHERLQSIAPARLRTHKKYQAAPALISTVSANPKTTAGQAGPLFTGGRKRSFALKLPGLRNDDELFKIFSKHRFRTKCSWTSAYYDERSLFDGGGKEKKMEDMEFEDGVFPRMLNEIEEINREEKHNVLFIASDGRNVYKAIHVPKMAIDKEDEPVLFAGSEANTYIAAYSVDTISKLIEETESYEYDEQQSRWNQVMEEMVQEISDKVDSSPPSGWIF